MSTTIQTLVDISRRHLLEATAKFWTDAELVALANRGIRDLWRAIQDNYQDYFLTVDTTLVSMAASTGTLNGVPADVSIVRGIEARTLTAYPSLHFRPKNYTHADFQTARAQSAIDPVNGGTIWYAPVGAGAPVGAPTIYVAPQVNSEVLLRFIYVPTFAEKAIGDTNPIPGESDQAIIAWIVAYARAKEREDRAPDEGWLGVYATEKKNILVALTPRQQDEEDVAEAFFEPYWP